jgi:hypothetical protein
MRVKHYLPTFGVSECVEAYSNPFMFPEIDDTSRWCNLENKIDILSGIVQASSAFLISIGTSILLITSVLI